MLKLILHQSSRSGGPSPMSAHDELIAKLHSLRAFLNGTAAIDGLFFGEAKPITPYRSGAFWWRKSHLPVIDEAAAALESMAGEVAKLREALAELANAARSACDARQHPTLIEALMEADWLINRASQALSIEDKER